MRTKIAFGAIVISILIQANLSCQKEVSCEDCNENNKPPIAVSGSDRVITLPTDSILLDGSASSDPDGTINGWQWTKISGPASFNLMSPNDSVAKVKNLTTGAYRFELKVTDNGGMSAKDTVQVTVIDPAQPNRPPVANAGPDQIITLPINIAALDGRATTDPDNNITTYAWTQIAGPPSSISNASAVQTSVTGLLQGVYQLELKVTDAGGLFSSDTMNVTVNAASLSLCEDNRPLVNAQLIPVGTLSQARSGMAVASAGNKILFAGGIKVDGGSGVPASRVDIYDMATQTWSTAELCLERYLIAATANGNKIFFAGGEWGDGTWPVDSVDIYDVSANTWSVGHLSSAGNCMAAASVGNKVLFAGGDQGFNGTPGIDRGRQIDIYDLTTNTWSTASLSEPKYGIAAVTLNSKVYFSGGLNFNTQSKKIEIYDNSTNSWALDTMYEAKSHHGSIAAGNRIFWAGGVDLSTDPYKCLVEIKNVNTASSSIEYLFRPAGWDSFTGQHLVMKNNKIIFLTTPESFRNKFDIYDLTTNAWSIGILPQPIPIGSSFISVNNTIYIAGGFINGSMTNQVWKLEF